VHLEKAMTIGIGILVVLIGAVAVFGHGWMAPADAAARKNPLPRDAATLEQGRTIYAEHCAECHGNSGRGDGPKASRTWPAPANLTIAVSHSPGDIAWKIETGRGEMPAFREKLSMPEIWAVTHWIRTFKR